MLKELAFSEDGRLSILGGQNPYAELAAGAEKIDLPFLSAYDLTCTTTFLEAMFKYLRSEVTYDEALDMFMKAVKAKYPELN